MKRLCQNTDGESYLVESSGQGWNRDGWSENDDLIRLSNDVINYYLIADGNNLTASIEERLCREKQK